MSGVKKQVDSQALPNKEQALFRQLIKQYEVFYYLQSYMHCILYVSIRY